MSPDEIEHRRAVAALVEMAIRDGCADLGSVLLRCEGADPVLVSEIFDHARGSSTIGSAPSPFTAPDALNLALPAPDPWLSQWWFSGSTVYALERRARQLTSGIADPAAICIGAPSLGAVLDGNRFKVSVLDVDADLCVAGHITEYDAAVPLPSVFKDRFDIAIADPPWYDAHFYTFLNRCLAALKMGGHALLTFPGVLTRPGLSQVKAGLVKEIVTAGHEIVSIVPGALHYQVPTFEAAALGHLPGFRGIPWRLGDLFEIAKRSDKLLTETGIAPSARQSFHRNPTEFRIFLDGQTRGAGQDCVEPLPDYARTVSKRGAIEPDVWSSEKTAAVIGDAALVRGALQCWSAGASKQNTINELAKSANAGLVKSVVDKIDAVFSLWNRFGVEPPLRDETHIKEARRASLTEWATPFTVREHPESTDGFRAEFQRDRDRILWSSGLRRLSNKTQLFPVEHDDDLRQRLTHSVEVLQIASTIGTSFGLDNDLIEAGALAHDIGHTPFGHAGEYALDQLFKVIEPRLGGFNHYEHGVDVLRYLEGPYYVSTASQFSGLNLSSELCECVLKHTYCHKGPSEISTEELLVRSKHSDVIAEGHCHLEGQAVRIADKVSYLISDLEDGIRLGVVTQADLLSCRFFHRSPLHFEGRDPLSLQFANQRRMVLKLLIEDILRASNQRLARMPRHPDGNVAGVRGADDYLVQYSKEMASDVSEIWEKVQSAKLHKDRRVVSASLQAARIVAELTTTYALVPELVDERFRSEYARLHDSPYMKAYTKSGRTVTFRPELTAFLPMHLVIGRKHEIGKPITTPVEQLVMAKDYVAALSDSARAAVSRPIA